MTAPVASSLPRYELIIPIEPCLERTASNIGTLVSSGLFLDFAPLYQDSKSLLWE